MSRSVVSIEPVKSTLDGQIDDHLETLASIFPDHSSSSLASILASCSNNLERATNALLSSSSGASTEARSKGTSKRRKVEVGLQGWLSSAGGSAKRGVKHGGEGSLIYREWPRVIKGTSSSSASSHGATATTSAAKLNAFTSLQPAPALVPASLPPLTLNTADAISLHTGGLCHLVPNILSRDLAGRLYQRMIEEEKGEEGHGDEASKAGMDTGWEVNRWWLADREVVSPHTTAFYVESGASSTSSNVEATQEYRDGLFEFEEASPPAYSADAFKEAARYWYNGEQRDARVFNDEMNEAREVIEPVVRKVMSTRPRDPLSSSLPWTPNVAAANCYRGSKESVGYHSDVLTYLGPLPVIASISLGVERVFRLRPALPSTSSRTLSIPLPHNSLLIMLDGCQERFKHCVMPASRGLDLFRLPPSAQFITPAAETQNMLGWRERINITFRNYRPDFAPLPVAFHPIRSIASTASLPSTFSLIQPPLSSPYAGAPLCRCGIPTTLRPDAKGKVRAMMSTKARSDEMMYHWTCNNGAQDEGRTCGYFRVLDMRREGRGEWFVADREKG